MAKKGKWCRLWAAAARDQKQQTITANDKLAKVIPLFPAKAEVQQVALAA